MCVDGDTKIFTNPKGHLKAGIQAENLYQLLRDNDPLKKKLDRVINEALQYY